MKITKTRLKQILNEEVQAFLQEADGGADPTGVGKLQKRRQQFRSVFDKHGPRDEQNCDGDAECMRRNEARARAKKLSAQIDKIQAKTKKHKRYRCLHGACKIWTISKRYRWW